jgi:hypothetical protein
MANWSTQPVTHLWRRHPGVRTDDDLSLGERAADRMRNLMGRGGSSRPRWPSSAGG